MAEGNSASTCRYPHRITQKWHERVDKFWDSLTKDARPMTILRKMKSAAKFHDRDIEKIMNLEMENNSVEASEKLLRYLLSEEELDAGSIAARWRAFEEALREVNPLLYDIVNGKYDPDIQERQRNLVDSFMDEICSRVDPSHLLPDLVSKELLGDMEKENLEKNLDNKGPTMAATYLVGQLHRSGNKDWLKDFFEVLRRNNHEGLAKDMSEEYERMLKTPSAKCLPAACVRPAQELEGQGGSNANGGARPKENLQPVKLQEEPCPTCGKLYKILSRHVCKEAKTREAQLGLSANGGARPKENLHHTTVGAKSEEQQCPTCGKKFKQLSRHICKEVKPAATTTQEVECPGCGKMFKQISKHVCKATVKPAAMASSGRHYGPTASDGACRKPQEPAVSARPGEQQCPTCGKMFKQLSRHVCKAQGAVVNPTNAHNGPSVCAKPEQPCPKCRKMFKQLSRHKCKA
ncbi:zinc finger protein 689-like [Littorina saxatilis]|uniref:Caspase recruitment domain-containing protein n=1 Tax=Littorina saxatilis TaxID=31220 RepID=A0AAN9BSS7_9CAEN